MCYCYYRISRKASTVQANISKKVASLDDTGFDIAVAKSIENNYSEQLAHILVLGNKQFLHKVFPSKTLDKLTKGDWDAKVADYLARKWADKRKDLVQVDGDLLQAAKRQRFRPAGPPPNLAGA
jgi:hypothetical protein